MKDVYCTGDFWLNALGKPVGFDKPIESVALNPHIYKKWMDMAATEAKPKPKNKVKMPKRADPPKNDATWVEEKAKMQAKAYKAQFASITPTDPANSWKGGGTITPIPEMTDSHLMNAMRMLNRKHLSLVNCGIAKAYRSVEGYFPKFALLRAEAIARGLMEDDEDYHSEELTPHPMDVVDRRTKKAKTTKPTEPAPKRRILLG